MKSILLSIKSQYVAKILNGEKTIEIRKRFPRGYVGWVYIYCTKKEPYVRRYVHNDKWGTLEYIKSDGKVVARFWCDKVEEISDYLDSFIPNSATFSVPYRLEGQRELLKRSCLTHEELIDYLKESEGYAIHITKLEIFDKPKEIKEFHKPSWAKVRYKTMREKEVKQYLLTRAPESYCYIEV